MTPTVFDGFTRRVWIKSRAAELVVKECWVGEKATQMAEAEFEELVKRGEFKVEGGL